MRIKVKITIAIKKESNKLTIKNDPTTNKRRILFLRYAIMTVISLKIFFFFTKLFINEEITKKKKKNKNFC